MSTIIARLNAQAPTAVRFVLVGVVNTFTGLAVIYGCKWLLSFPDVPANLAGYAVGLVVSYFLNARWTFSFRGQLNTAVPRFAFVVILGYLANIAVVSAALHLGHINSYLAQATGIAPYTLVTYFGSKYYVFAAGSRARATAAT